MQPRILCRDGETEDSDLTPCPDWLYSEEDCFQMSVPPSVAY